jgi:hypothetical protein
MKRLVLASLASLFCLLLVISIAPAYASVTVKTIIDDAFHVSFDFRNLNSTMYNATRASFPAIFNYTSIPSAIIKSLEQQNLWKVSWSQIPANNFFDYDEKWIHIEFSLAGDDILSQTVDRAAMIRTYTAKTNWIKFAINLTNTFTLNFTKYFTTPVANWQRIDNSFHYNSTAYAAPFDLICSLALPNAAKNIRAVEYILIFDMPLLIEDELIDSPFLILGAMIVAIMVANIYRKVRK